MQRQKWHKLEDDRWHDAWDYYKYPKVSSDPHYISVYGLWKDGTVSIMDLVRCRDYPSHDDFEDRIFDGGEGVLPILYDDPELGSDEDSDVMKERVHNRINRLFEYIDHEPVTFEDAMNSHFYGA